MLGMQEDVFVEDRKTVPMSMPFGVALPKILKQLHH